ncbi:MAG: PfkB family carbohydrate kinase [Mucilaginibacter sp.]
MMVDICCVGHITSDKVVTPSSVAHMPGGTAWYFSHALSKLDVSYLLVTSLGLTEMNYITSLRKIGMAVDVHPSAHTVYFENIYGDNPDERKQNVLEKAEPFKVEDVVLAEAKIYHLGPLLADDISLDVIKVLAQKGIVSLDVQGYLRKVINHKVYPCKWPDKDKALPYITILKADQNELLALTGLDNIEDAILQLADVGVKEIVITNGSKGSVIYHEGFLHKIPAYFPSEVVDTTGCGDTYMAGYLYCRVKGIAVKESGEFAAAIAGLKTRLPGPFNGTAVEVREFIGLSNPV